MHGMYAVLVRDREDPCPDPMVYGPFWEVADADAYGEAWLDEMVQVTMKNPDNPFSEEQIREDYDVSVLPMWRDDNLTNDDDEEVT